MIFSHIKMAVSLMTCVLSLVTISLCSVVVLSEENIPIIAWSNSKSLTGVHPFAQEPLYASISKIVYNNEKIILFTQEKMSFDDLAKYGGLYGSEGVLNNIKDYISSSASSVMLSAPYQPNLVTFLVDGLSFLYNVDKTEYFTAEDIMTDDAEFVNSNCKICVISLPEASSSSTSDQASHLAESDKFIGSVMGKDVVQKDKYITMVTAKYSQMHSKQQPTLKREARALSAENCNIPFRHCTDNETFPESNDTCYFLMRFDEIIIFDPVSNSHLTIQKSNTSNTTEASPTSCVIEDYSALNATYRIITVTYTGIWYNTSFEDDAEVTIKYLLPFNHPSLTLPNGFWTLELNVTIENIPYFPLKYKKEGIPPYPLAVPEGASFHCSNATYCMERSMGDLSRCNYSFPRVTIKGLQVELFDKINQTEFSIAFDCEPYFSAATWMGVFTLSILLPILIVGFFLVFQTQTMDRFDDPREPVLQTTVLD